LIDLLELAESEAVNEIIQCLNTIPIAHKDALQLIIRHLTKLLFY